jgi:peroxin-2
MVASSVRMQTFLFLIPKYIFSKLELHRKASRLPRKILLVHGALTIVLPYIHTRLRGHALSKAWPDAPSSDRRRKAWELMTMLETAHAAIALASFVAFLWDGR